MAYLAGSHHGTPIEGLTPAGPVVVAKPPHAMSSGEAAAAARSRRVAAPGTGFCRWRTGAL